MADPGKDDVACGLVIFINSSSHNIRSHVDITLLLINKGWSLD